MKKKKFCIFPKTLANGKTVYYYSCYDEKGKRRQFSTGKEDEIEATEIVLERFRNGTLIQNTNLAFNTYAYNFFNYDGRYVQNRIHRGYSYSRSCCDKNNSIINKKAIPFFGTWPLNMITTRDIEDWITAEKKTGLSNATLNRRIKTLRLIFNEAFRLQDITFNPFDAVKLFHDDTKSKGIYTEKEIKTLFKEKESVSLWKNKTSYLINYLAVLTGMRLGELQALRVEDLSPNSIKVSHSYDAMYGIKETKTGESREIPISLELYEELVSMLMWQKNGYIFSLNNGVKPVNRNYIYKDYYSAMNKIGLTRETLIKRNLSFHSYRHTFASILANNNVPELFIRKLTGHASQQVFNGYTHIEIEQLRKAMA